MILDNYSTPRRRKKGLVVTDELIHHTHHSADSCHCRRSTPTPQLHSSDCMCEHIPGNSSPPLTSKHNYTRLHTHTPCAETSAASHLSALHIYGYARHTFTDTQRYSSGLKIPSFPIFPVQWPCEWVNSVRGALEDPLALANGGYV